MKIRQGFVSNSSSSSFIIGIAKIEDLEKFKKWSKSFTDVKYKKIRDIVSSWDIFKNSEKIVINTFTGAEVQLNINGLSDDEYIAYIHICNNEGDSYFCGDNYDYDIDYDFFDTDQQKLISEFSEDNGLSNISLYYGAGRNG
jgi:hypothetical protein